MHNELEVSGVSAGYGNAQALHDVGLFVRKGECVACVGANGAGKSTLLRVIAGLHRSTAGRISMAGKDLTGFECYQRARMGLTLVPEGRRILPLSVGENLRAGQIESRHGFPALEEVLDRFPILRERWDLPALSMSGGEQQMLAIGRALVSRPSVLLLDEPSLGLAPVMIDELIEHLKGIVSDGTTVLLVEQNLRVAVRLSSRLYLLKDGHMVREMQTEQSNVEEIVS
ncbi:MAG: ABC transporter ATP-binding protein, partial [Hyphomicrobium sp.]|nr:ABC transporter ATP-binding protein [Hyphomicrobium sp.]